jgi:ornithine cyclodeaminase
MSALYVPGAAARDAITLKEAIACMARVFALYAEQQAHIYPVVDGKTQGAPFDFAVKSGRLRIDGSVGLKVGTYAPANAARGLPNHGSTTILLEPETGLLRAVIDATELNALRTAAADGAAIDALARCDVRSLGVVGTGHQAWWDVAAARLVRPGLRVARLWNRNPSRAEHFAARLRATGIAAEVVGLEDACRSDVVICATAASEPLVRAGWVSAGTHISAMGADAHGKIELDPHLTERAELFADCIEQAITIGEFKAAFAAGLIRRDRIRTLGSVLAGGAGRSSEDAITIFDSSGLAIQDIAIAELVLSRVENSAQVIALA